MRHGSMENLNGKPTSSSSAKWVAIDDDRKTIGRWSAYCDGAAGYGKADCQIYGKGSAYRGGGGMGCPAFKNFQPTALYP